MFAADVMGVAAALRGSVTAQSAAPINAAGSTNTSARRKVRSRGKRGSVMSQSEMRGFTEFHRSGRGILMRIGTHSIIWLKVAASWK
jgi:hypothetical protein